MKTALTDLIEALELDIKYITDDDSKEDRYHRQGLKYACDLAKEKLKKEKELLNNFYKAGEKNVDFDSLHGYGSLSNFEKHFEETFKS